MGRWWLPTGQTTSNATTVLIPGKRSKRRVRYAQAAHRSVGKIIKNFKKRDASAQLKRLMRAHSLLRTSTRK